MREDRCHCGDRVAAVTDPTAYRDLGPAPRHLCEDCVWVRCDLGFRECGK